MWNERQLLVINCLMDNEKGEEEKQSSRRFIKREEVGDFIHPETGKGMGGRKGGEFALQPLITLLTDVL